MRAADMDPIVPTMNELSDCDFTFFETDWRTTREYSVEQVDATTFTGKTGWMNFRIRFRREVDVNVDCLSPMNTYRPRAGTASPASAVNGSSSSSLSGSNGTSNGSSSARLRQLRLQPVIMMAQTGGPGTADNQAGITGNSAATTPNHHLTDPSITLGEATPELPQGDRHATGSATRSLPLGSRDGPSDSPDSGARLGGFNRQFVLQTALQTANSRIDALPLLQLALTGGAAPSDSMAADSTLPPSTSSVQ